MNSGTKPAYRDNRDYDYHATFGAITTFPDELNLDAGLTMPDQNADQNPFECTDYTLTDIATDEDKILFVHGYLYAKTLLIAGNPANFLGADIRDSLKASRVYGLLPLDKAPTSLIQSGEGFNSDYRHWPIELDAEAGKYRRGAYFNVQPLNGDWFDGIRSALQVNKVPISIGTPWYQSFDLVGPTGIVDVVPVTKPVSWHNWAIKGWKTINGVPYLAAKTWQGTSVGDHGWLYFSRETINALWKIHGTQAFTVAKALPVDVQTIKTDILQTVIALLLRIIANL